MSETLLAWAMAIALVLAVLAVNSFRIVPADERLVRFRAGRAGHRVKGPGPVVVLPGVDRAVRVPLTKTWTDVLRLEATTRDGVAVTVSGAALTFVRDPGDYAAAVDPPGSSTADGLESEIGRYVAERDLAELSASTADQDGGLASRVNAITAEWGVEVDRVELDRIEVPVDADLIRWAEGFARPRPPNRARRHRRSGHHVQHGSRKGRRAPSPFPRRSAVRCSGRARRTALTADLRPG
ncbi:MAG: SPFH domain-containing protein [Pseudonocardia sp.]